MKAFTTKSEVYALIRDIAGTDLLIWPGAVMAVFQVAHALRAESAGIQRISVNPR
jgi:hypothetical protein